MSRLVALGEEVRVVPFALAGVEVVPAGDAAAVVAAWETVAADAGVIILTPAAARALATRLEERPRLLAVVMPG